MRSNEVISYLEFVLDPLDTLLYSSSFFLMRTGNTYMSWSLSKSMPKRGIYSGVLFSLDTCLEGDAIMVLDSVYVVGGGILEKFDYE